MVQCPASYVQRLDHVNEGCHNSSMAAFLSPSAFPGLGDHLLHQICSIGFMLGDWLTFRWDLNPLSKNSPTLTDTPIR